MKTAKMLLATTIIFVVASGISNAGEGDTNPGISKAK